MNLGPQMADISVDNQRANFNTGPYGNLTPLLKIKILKIGYVHAKEDQKESPIFMNIGPQMANIKVDNRNGIDF